MPSRPILALIIPVPILFAAAIAARNLPTSSSIRTAIEYPAAGLNALLSAMGSHSSALPKALAAALIYLLLALLLSAALSPKKSLGHAAALASLCSALLGCLTYIYLIQ